MDIKNIFSLKSFLNSWPQLFPYLFRGFSLNILCYLEKEENYSWDKNKRVSDFIYNPFMALSGHWHTSSSIIGSINGTNVTVSDRHHFAIVQHKEMFTAALFKIAKN
jgi:hypothetical protein